MFAIILFRSCGLAAVVAAGQALRPKDDQDRVRHVDAGNQLAVDVELAAGRHSIPLGNVGLAGRLELVAQLDFALRDRLIGLQPELVPAQEVIQEVQPLILDEEGVTASAAALGEQHALCAALRDHDFGRDAPGPVVGFGRWR